MYTQHGLISTLFYPVNSFHLPYWECKDLERKVCKTKIALHSHAANDNKIREG